MSTTAKQQVIDLLKRIYDNGDVNAFQIWKGYDASTDENGWHCKWFGRSEVTYLGKSVSEVREWVEEQEASNRADYAELKRTGAIE